MGHSHRARLAALLLAATLAAACGVGGGGTGTGETAHLAAAGAKAANLCETAFAGALACGGHAGQPGPASHALGPGTAEVHFVDTAAGGKLELIFSGHGLRLQARCQHLSFEGDWGTVDDQEAFFFGDYVIEAAGRPVQSTVSVQSAPGLADALQIVLREPDGRLVLGPIVVQKGLPRAPPAACP